MTTQKERMELYVKTLANHNTTFVPLKEMFGKILEVGSWVMQTAHSHVAYGLVTAIQKNGGAKVISFTQFNGERISGKAKIGSTKGWHPAPVVIDESEVPPKIKEKIMARKS